MQKTHRKVGILIRLFYVFALLCSPLFSAHPLVRHVIQCLKKAEYGFSKLDEKVLRIEGMSSRKQRLLLNNLCSLRNASYLEIGCWKGSTLVASLYKNNINLRQAVAIDNWSEFGGPREEFLANVAAFLPESPLRIIEEDCFQIDKDQVFSTPVNIYFYDGNHDVLNQEKAFTFFNSVFSDVFIAVIDDWNWSKVRTGTFSAFEKLGYTILFEQQFFDTIDLPMGWNNGTCICVIQKNAIH